MAASCSGSGPTFVPGSGLCNVLMDSLQALMLLLLRTSCTSFQSGPSMIQINPVCNFQTLLMLHVQREAVKYVKDVT